MRSRRTNYKFSVKRYIQWPRRVQTVNAGRLERERDTSPTCTSPKAVKWVIHPSRAMQKIPEWDSLRGPGDTTTNIVHFHKPWSTMREGRELIRRAFACLKLDLHQVASEEHSFTDTTENTPTGPPNLERSGESRVTPVSPMKSHYKVHVLYMYCTLHSRLSICYLLILSSSSLCRFLTPRASATRVFHHAWLHTSICSKNHPNSVCPLSGSSYLSVYVYAYRSIYIYI